MRYPIQLMDFLFQSNLLFKHLWVHFNLFDLHHFGSINHSHGLFFQCKRKNNSLQSFFYFNINRWMISQNNNKPTYRSQSFQKWKMHHEKSVKFVMLLLFLTSPVFGEFIETEDLMEPRFGNLPKLEIKYEVFFYSIKNFNSKFLLKFEINLRFKYWPYFVNFALK
jgi:hypothetical protein